MSTNKGSFGPDGLTIAYKELGTISIDEFKQAVIADVNARKTFTTSATSKVHGSSSS